MSIELLNSPDASQRMTALCAFIEFFIDARQPSFGEPAEALARFALPMPLKRLYEFAGRWPRPDGCKSSEYVVPALSEQDHLYALDFLEIADNGKLKFLSENQGVWDCRTLTEGDDPPVWCVGDHADENNNCFRGEKLICESLSRFLITFVLQEMTLTARMCLSEDGLAKRFKRERDTAQPVWLNGPYVGDLNSNFFLWKDLLVVERSSEDNPLFGANSESGIRFLNDNQGPIVSIGLSIGRNINNLWIMNIQANGSASVECRGIKERAEVQPHSLDFPTILERLRQSDGESGERSVSVHFQRKGQRVSIARPYGDRKYVESLLRRVVARHGGALKKRLEQIFPPH